MTRTDRISTLELLKRFGYRKVKYRSRKTQTYQEAWDSTSHTDYNERYDIRLELLKIAGHIS